jgi:dTMP kinase
VALTRAKQLGTLDRIESEQVQFFTQVRNAYLQRAKELPEQFVKIDASLDLPRVEKQITEQLERLISCYEIK